MAKKPRKTTKKKEMEEEEVKPSPVKVTTKLSDDEAATLRREYDEGNSLLQQRIENKEFGFDTYEKMYNSYIDRSKWPYNAVFPTPRAFTSLFNKGARMIGGRFTGQVDGVEPNDELGARVATEHFKWSVERFNQWSDTPIEQKIFQWDQNTRTYGAGFLRVFWKLETKTYRDEDGKKHERTVYDNWDIEVVSNRDLITQPGRETLGKSDWVIHRRYLSLDQLKRISEDGADFDQGALKQLEKFKSEKPSGNDKESNYVPYMLNAKGLDSTSDNRFEVCTTYYKDRWITWVPGQGSDKEAKVLVLRVIDNPYRHQDFPFVPLVYIPFQDDVYGQSELQAIKPMIKILSAFNSQIIELINRELYPPTLVNTGLSQIETFSYRSKAFWQVQDVNNAVKTFEGSQTALNKFVTIYKMMITEISEALGETGSSISQVDQMGGNKTATEIDDKAFIRNARDNLNKIMLRAGMKRLMYLIFEMLRDPKFTDKGTVIKVVGRDALEYFDKQGISDWGLTDEGYQYVMDYAEGWEMAGEPEEWEALEKTAEAQGIDIFTAVYLYLDGTGDLDPYKEPLAGQMTPEGQYKPRYNVSSNEDNVGYLKLDPENDYLGEYNFIPDVEALGMPDNEREVNTKLRWYNLAAEHEQQLQQEGYTLKHKEVLTTIGELSDMKEVDRYFEAMDVEGGDPNGQMAGQSPVMGAVQQGGMGAGSPGTGQAGPGVLGGETVPTTPQGIPNQQVGQSLP